MSGENVEEAQTRLTRRDWLSVTGATVGAAIVGSSSTGNVAAQTTNEPRINLGDNFYIDDVDGSTLAIKEASDGSTAMEYDATADEWTLPAVNAEVINNIETPQHYGAVGDGVTDDTQAFLDWDAQASAGDVLFIPPGDYLLQSISSDAQNDFFIKFDTDDITVFGAGKASRLFTDQTPNSTFTDIIKSEGQRTYLGYVHLDGPGTSNNLVAGWHQSANNTTWGITEGVRATNFGDYGLDYSGAGDWIVSDCVVTDVVDQAFFQSNSSGGILADNIRAYRAGLGLHVDGAGGGSIRGFKYDNEDAKNSGIAIRTQTDAKGQTYTGIDIRNCQRAIGTNTSNGDLSFIGYVESVSTVANTFGGNDIDLENIRYRDATTVVDDSATRTRWGRVIGGGPIGGVDLSTTTGQFPGDLAIADGTSAAAAGAMARWDGSAWQYHDPTGTV